jgi:type I restriction enzyme, R subunit
VALSSQFSAKQRVFLEFVLAHYVSEGVQELDQEKLKPLLQLKYGTIDDAVKDLGSPEEIGKAFVGFQKYLYQG